MTLNNSLKEELVHRLLGSVGEPINPEAWNWYFKNIGKGNYCSDISSCDGSFGTRSSCWR